MRDGMLALLTLASAIACLSLAEICARAWQGTHNRIIRSMQTAFFTLGVIYGLTGVAELLLGSFDDPHPQFTFWRPFAIRGGPALVFWYLTWTLGHRPKDRR